jgi:hypothetical protein
VHEMDAITAVGWLLLATVLACLMWLVLHAVAREKALDARLAAGDMTLFDEGGLDIEEVVRAPLGSVLQQGRLMEVDVAPAPVQIMPDQIT